MSSTALNKILEIAEAKCDEGSYLEIANLLKELHVKEKPAYKYDYVGRKDQVPQFIMLPNATHGIGVMIPVVKNVQQHISEPDEYRDSYAIIGGYEIQHVHCQIYLPLDTPELKRLYKTAKQGKLWKEELEMLGVFQGRHIHNLMTIEHSNQNGDTRVWTQELPVVGTRKMCASEQEFYDDHIWREPLPGDKYLIIYRGY